MADGVILDAGDARAVAAVAAIRGGDPAALRRLLAAEPGLATARIRDGAATRTLLHVVTDWPGHVPAGPATVAALVAAGADVNARFTGAHAETPLHWAASCDDVAVLDALLDAGADIDAGGAVIAGGTALDDARAFGQWQAAHRLVERGARTTIHDAAALGLTGLLDRHLAARPAPDELGTALWWACHGGQRACAERLLEHGADLDHRPPWEDLTPLDAAVRAGAADLADELRARGAATAAARRGPGR
ncbi:ankyrin repeat domain-containing protein [Spirilliplanes yamanashiensis]|uniref:ankyrin repeat domain-containing protein n=1 Tax=Spirilliplanes yamanashiensis TaxID=42233 RepID=UPI00194EF59F|nr:ankyrin repeat domain-containing protein [Spirilliplanes yamanashiensis]MDP9816273.1 ankyrin repeat protein [Spirilliplanes yamanashiensis]